MSVRLYAVLRMPHRRRVVLPAGLHGEALRIINCGGVSAAVADVSVPVEASAANLFAFDRVLWDLANVSDGILPARFGAVAQNAAALTSAVASQAPDFAAALERVAGRVQMTVRIPESTSGKRSRRRTTGTEYLRNRAGAPGAAGLAALRRAVRENVCAEHVETAPEGVRVYHLIESGAVNEYIARASGFAVSGPFLPHAFVPGIDHALSAKHDDKKHHPSKSRSSRSGAGRRSAGNSHR
jgi:hypothetical protein